MKNPVAKYMNEYNKPSVERDRKKNPSKKQRAAELAERFQDKELADRLAPYERGSPRNLLLEWDDDDLPDYEEEEYEEDYDPMWDDVDANGRCKDTGCPCHEGAFDYRDECDE